MTSKDALSLKDAKSQFTTILNNIKEDDKGKFITFLFEELCHGSSKFFEEGEGPSYDNPNSNGSDFNDADALLDDPVSKLNSIADDIKKRVPIDAILPSEKILAPATGENADCLSDLTVHVDDFLYNEDDVEELVEDGKLKRNYCKDCGSKNIEPLIFISHSMSRDALYYVFNSCLPTLEDKTVLDIGSRLGAILYGAYVFTDAPKIIGVEMNEDLCKLQKDVINKYKMTDRIEVLNKKIEDSEDVVKTADVILINNAFEFYVSEEKQIEIWQYLKRSIKSKTILVTRPHLETTFKNLNTGIVQNEWVKPFEIEGDEDDEYCDIAFYEVL